MSSRHSPTMQNEGGHGMLKITKILLKTFGALPLDSKNNSIRLIRPAIFWFYMGCTCTLFFANAVSTYKRSLEGNLPGFFESLSYTTIVGDAIFKLTVYLGPFVKNISARLDLNEQAIRANSEHNKTYTKRSNFAEKITKMWLQATGISLLYLLTRPLHTTVQKADGSTGRGLITAYWFPIDPEKYYIAAYLTEVVLMITTSEVIVFSDVFVCTLLYSCIGQLEVINSRLRNISRDSLKMAEEKNIPLHEAQMVVIKDIAVTHQNMIAMVKDIDDALRWFFLFQFLMSSLRVALTIFDVFWRDMDFMEQALEYLYVVNISLEVAIYYYIANDIMLYSSDGIYNAVAMSNYDELCPSASQMLQTILSAAKIPLTLSIGLFDVVSIDTLLKIVKSGYYALSILNNLEAKGRKN